MEKAFVIENVTFAYRKDRRLFEDFSLEIDRRTSTVITGPNGSGKTTLSKVMMGLLKPQKGRVLLFGQEIQKMNLGQIGQQVGYVFQNPERQLFATTVIEELIFPRIIKGDDKGEVLKKAEVLLHTFDLAHLKESYPFFLSYGEKRRLAIAAVLMADPAFMILDEPTSSLDKQRIQSLTDILHKLKAMGVGSLMISHDLEFIATHGERVIRLESGSVVEDVT